MNKKVIAFLSLSFSCFASECGCLGPDNIIANAPLRPITCNGDFIATASVIYWSAHQDGMKVVINNDVGVPVINPTLVEIQELNNLTKAKYEGRGTKWDFGYQFGIGYNSACDGWNINFVWTHFQPLTVNSVEASVDQNQTLVTLWSDFAAAQGSITFGRFFETNWKLNLDILDLTLGRSFWASRRFSMQPYIGLRLVNIRQDYKIEQLGGSWSPRTNPDQIPLTNLVHLDNDYRGIGLKAGLMNIWHIGCGWGIYGDASGSIIYGTFSIKHDEENRTGIAPYTKNKILEVKNHFHASRAILDYALGVEYSARFADSAYGVTGRLGWEERLFFHQNQLWRINRIGNIAGIANDPTGENIFSQTRGTLDTSGITLNLILEF